MGNTFIIMLDVCVNLKFSFSFPQNAEINQSAFKTIKWLQVICVVCNSHIIIIIIIITFCLSSNKTRARGKMFFLNWGLVWPLPSRY